MPNKHLLTLVAAGPLLVGKTLVALGLRRNPEGWRRSLGVGMRGEAGKFTLSAFGLRPPADPVAALSVILPGQPAARYRLAHHRSWVERRPAVPKAVGLRYAADGELLEVIGHPADVTAYNRTRHLPEADRPRRLVGHPLFDTIGVSWEDHFEHRFQPPDFLRCRGFGGGPLQIVLRPAGDTLDVWAHFHHTANDGGQAQELMTALEQVWGPAADVPYPPAGTTFAPRLCSAPGEREVYEAIGFHDLGPLLAERKELAARRGIELPAGPLLAWRLAARPEFAGVTFATTADVPAADGYERDVGLVPVRPADFADLAAYAAAYRAALEAVRRRRGPVRELMSGAGLLPPGLYAAMSRVNPGRVDRTFGTVGLSVLKTARVVSGSLSDCGYPGGFVVVGGVKHGVGPISVKGTREQAAGHHAVLRTALAG